MYRRTVRTTVAAAVLALGVAGCSSDSNTDAGAQAGGTSSAAAATTTAPVGREATGDVQAWAGKVCAAISPEMAGLGQGPDIDPTDPQKAKAGLVTYLDTLAGGMGKMVSGLESAGAPPVTDGAAVLDRVVTSLEQAQQSIVSAKTNLEAADVNDPTALQAALTQVSTDLQTLSDMEDPTKGLRGDAELDAAFANAPECKDMNGSAEGGATAGATPTS